MKEFLKRIPYLKRLVCRIREISAARQLSQNFKRSLRVRPLRIVIGAGGIHEPGWIGTEIAQLNLLCAANWRKYFLQKSIDVILAEHVWEHLTLEEGVAAACQCFEYLRPGGHARIAVPDGFHPDSAYIDYVRPGGHGAGAEDHKVLYNHESLSRIFQEAGFRVNLLEYFDSTGAFHFVDWDPAQGMIHRSRRFDERNQGGSLAYTSLIIDAYRERE